MLYTGSLKTPVTGWTVRISVIPTCESNGQALLSESSPSWSAVQR
jgi:hypothetical protein